VGVTLLVTGTFVPMNFRSQERFVPWNFRSLELSFPGTFGNPAVYGYKFITFFVIYIQL